LARVGGTADFLAHPARCAETGVDSPRANYIGAGMVELGKGIYLVPEAARLVGVRSPRLRRWMLGAGNEAPVLPTPPEIFDGQPALDFADLVSALFIQAFREQGVTLQHIRRVAAKAANELNDPRPFCLKHFTTDGHRIYRWIDDDKAARALVDVVTGQYVIRPVYEPLLRSIDFGINRAERWHPLGQGHLVVIDPGLSFGAPTVRGIPTRVLYGPVQAGDSTAVVARWFKVAEAEVLAACEFERKMRAKKAA
jgi:uncharacterized protein (DUF433 family)